jgi:uncharacterized protein (TIRG00374 family)
VDSGSAPGEGASHRLGRRARPWIGVLTSAVAITAVLVTADLGRTMEVARTAQPVWLVMAAGAIFLDILVRAERWRVLLAPIKTVAYVAVLGYLLIGYLANNVLPARLGELVRCHYVGDREGISRTTAIGTVVVERVIDTVSVVAIALVSILVLGVSGPVASAVVIGGAFTAFLVLALAVSLFVGRLPLADRFAALSLRWPRIAGLPARLREGLRVAVRPRIVVVALVLSAISWSLATSAYWFCGQTFGLSVTVAGAALLAAGTALSTAIPAGPAYLGTFEFAASRIGAAIGIPSAAALTLALTVHAVILLVTSLGGAVAVGRFGWWSVNPES